MSAELIFAQATVKFRTFVSYIALLTRLPYIILLVNLKEVL